jgi:predicted dehydrogenase
MPDDTLRVALIGCGRRGSATYLPVLRKLSRHFRVTAVCDEEPERAELAARSCGAVPYRHLERLLDTSRPDLAVVCVSPPPSDRNAVVAAQCLAAGVPILAETPIAKSLAEADTLLEIARRAGVAAEIAENYSRTPWERFTRVLIASQVFGAVHVVYSDFIGHGYHGVSVIRGHIGFEIPVTRVIGLSRDYAVARHEYRPGEWRDEETWQFGVIEFANGARGVLSFSTLSYGSPLRWGRAKCAVRFLAERGMGAGHDLAVLAGDGDVRPIQVQRSMTVVDGQDTLAALTSDLPGGLGWENPLREYPLAVGDQHDEVTVGLELLSVFNTIRHGAEPEYPLERAYVDRQVDLAVTASALENGAAVPLDAAAPLAARGPQV